jgi:factor associated with neutral sphingomyelinase activation
VRRYAVLTSSADVKELSPEFFTPQADFLRNSRGLPLGVRQKDGAELGDVVGLCTLNQVDP